MNGIPEVQMCEDAQSVNPITGIKVKGPTPNSFLSGKIEVDTRGNVYKIFKHKKHLIKTYCREGRYLRVGIYINGKSTSVLLHRLIWISRHGMPSNPYMQTNHIDGDTFNNNIENLEMVTAKQNQRHSGLFGKKSTIVHILKVARNFK
jgi:hypothetical protein